MPATSSGPIRRSRRRIADYISLFTDIFLRLIKMIIAPLVFSTLVVGVAHMGDTKAVGRIGAKAMVWFVAASLVSLLLGMVLVNVLRPGDNLNLPLPDARGRDQSQGHLAFDEGVCRASRAALDRRGDGDQRDPSDRGVLAVLRRGVRRARRARPQAGRRHRGALPRHPVDHRLHHGARADRGVCVDGRHRDDPGSGHPRDLRQVRRSNSTSGSCCCGAC